MFWKKVFRKTIKILVYTEFILVRLWRKLLAYRNTLESVPGINQYWAISVKFLAQGNNGLSLTGFEPMRLAILILLVRRVISRPRRHFFFKKSNKNIVDSSSEKITMRIDFYKEKNVRERTFADRQHNKDLVNMYQVFTTKSYLD